MNTPDARALSLTEESHELIATDLIFRERIVDVALRNELLVLSTEALLPLLVLFPIAELKWLLAWEFLWLTSISGRLVMRFRYARRYPRPQLPAHPRRWALARHVYQAFSWFTVGLLGLFCFVPNSLAWEIASVAGLCAVFPLSQTDTVERGEIVVASIALAIPESIMLASRGTPTHFALLALMLGVLFILTLWGTQQLSVRRNEFLLRRELEREKLRAESANIAKSKFLAAASHDLRQPLHALSLFVEALRTQPLTQSAQSLIGNIESSVRALEGLFNALLDISKLDAGTVTPERADFALHELLDRIHTEYREMARAKGLGWKFDCANAVVNTDPALLETIIRNLVTNAIRYTRDGAVYVRCEASQTHAVIAIIDTGIGIPADKQGDVFREFVQLHNPERDRTKGLGLGLSIVDRLTRLLELPLQMQSEFGVGTTISIQVPLGDPARIKHAEPVDRITLDPLHNRIVLIVDDERHILEGMRALLEGWGASTILAETEQSAVAQLKELQVVPDIIVADFRLRNEATGAQAIEAIRAHCGHPVPAIIVTGDTAPERLKEASSAGFLLLHKPVKPAKLRSAMLHLLQTPA